jgi:hypothetical protein
VQAQLEALALQLRAMSMEVRAVSEDVALKLDAVSEDVVLKLDAVSEDVALKLDAVSEDVALKLDAVGNAVSETQLAQKSLLERVAEMLQEPSESASDVMPGPYEDAGRAFLRTELPPRFGLGVIEELPFHRRLGEIQRPHSIR